MGYSTQNRSPFFMYYMQKLRVHSLPQYDGSNINHVSGLISKVKHFTVTKWSFAPSRALSNLLVLIWGSYWLWGVLFSSYWPSLLLCFFHTQSKSTLNNNHTILLIRHYTPFLRGLLLTERYFIIHRDFTDNLITHLAKEDLEHLRKLQKVWVFISVGSVSLYTR